MTPSTQAIRRLSAHARSLDSRLGDLAVVGVAVSAIVLQRVVVLFAPVDGAGELLRRVVICSATALLVLLALRFRRFVGAYLISLGIGLNLLAMLLHGGLMPVAYESLGGHWSHIPATEIGNPAHGSKDVILHRGDILLEPLADRYVIEAPLYGPNVYSLGDLVLFGGLLLAVGQAIWVVGGEVRRREQIAPG